MALDRLLAVARARTIGGVLLTSLDTLSPQAVEAVTILAELSAHVPVLALDQPWVSELGRGLSALAAYLTAAARQQRSVEGRLAVAVAKARGVPVGRPSRPVPSSAIGLALLIGVGRAARATGVPATTLRRAVRARAATSATCAMNVGDYFTTDNKEGTHVESEAVAVAG